MFINYFLPKQSKLRYKDIDVYTTIVAFFIALWATFVSIIGIRNYFFISSTLSFYLFVDMFFIPFHKIDILFHHLNVIFLLYQGIGSSQKFHNQITILLTRTEASSILLAPCYILNKYRKDYPSTSTILNIIFAISFVYFRIFSLTYGLLFDKETYDVLEEKSRSMTRVGYYSGLSFLATFQGLQYYWLYHIINVLILKRKKTTKHKL